jgi:hypothetical protein
VLGIERTEGGYAVVMQQTDMEGRSRSGYLGDGDGRCAVGWLLGLIARGRDGMCK